MKRHGDRYVTEHWTPHACLDFQRVLNLDSRTFDQFIKDDRHIFKKQFAEDNNL